MRIVFFGATELGYRCCQTLLEMGQNVVGIVTMPPQFQISYSPMAVTNVTYRDFTDLALSNDIPMVRVERSTTEPVCMKALAEWRPDFGLVAGWYHMIPRRVRDVFPLGVAAIHASLLPKYRGGAPLVWAIINGETKTGVTLFYLDDGVDTGDIIGQSEFEIEPHDTIREVYLKASEAAIRLIRQYIPMIAQGTAPRVPQDHSAATQFPQRSPADGLIDWTQSASAIRNFIRAQTRPYPGAFTYIGGKKVIIWDADILDEPSAASAS